MPFNSTQDQNDFHMGEDNVDRPCAYAPGEKLQHKLTGDWLIAVRIGMHQIKCRNKAGRLVWYYDEELEPIQDHK